MKMYLLFVLILALTAASTLSAKPVVQLGVDELLAAARPHGGTCYPVEPSPQTVPGAPKRMLAYYANGTAEYLSIPLVVPKEGYYSLVSTALWGPWVYGRLGRFHVSVNSELLPNALQGWYSSAPRQPFRIINQEWGKAYFPAQVVEVQLKLTTYGQGGLVLLGDLRLEPVAETALQPADVQRKIPPLVSPVQVPPAPAQVQMKWQRGLEWTTCITRAAKAITIDGKLSEWPVEKDPIRIDASILPNRGWAIPPPESPVDLSAKVTLSWDDQYLYLAAQVRDDERQTKTDAVSWQSPFGHDGLVLNLIPPAVLTGGARASGPPPLLVSLGFSYYSPGARPRPMPAGAEYAVTDTKDGYLLEAKVPFSVLGWSPAHTGDRFSFGLILVDVDPQKPAGRKFDQYGWNFGPGSAAGMGEARLLGVVPVAGDLIPAKRDHVPGSPMEFVGCVDLKSAATLRAIELVSLDDGKVAESYPINRRFDKPGRYNLQGQVTLPDLPVGKSYDLRMRWE
ncbi:MAG: DOMON domain-containing protein [Armatimonadota bacterium]